MGCEDFAIFLEEERRRRAGHFGSGPLIIMATYDFSIKSVLGYLE